MPKAVIIHKTGGPEVLTIENIAAPKEPGPGQVIIKQTAIGINFMDIYYRKGVYKAPRLPMIPGMEACGVVQSVGEGVTIPVGQRVIYATSQTGAYCQVRRISEKHLIGIPDNIPDNVAVSIFAKALTAHYLLFRTCKINKGDIILVHAAAGGVGQILCQWAKYLGAYIIGVVGSANKIQVAQNNGCDMVVVSSQTDFTKQVQQITNNKGVKIVFDSVGEDTFKQSLKSLCPLGLMVSYGQSSGKVSPVDILSLAEKGLYLTRPTLKAYTSSRRELLFGAIEVFTALNNGIIRPDIGNQYTLDQIAKAHADIESRKTTGSNIIIL
jgi:NADPH2:quinone reductase